MSRSKSIPPSRLRPRLSKLSSPDRVLVELPETVIASSQSKIPVGSAGVKGVRIGMDGKTPPTTSVVIDLEKPLAYELTPGSAGKVILTLHSEGAAPIVAKNNSAPVKASSPAPVAKAAVATAQPAAAAKPAAPPKVALVNMTAPKATAQTSKPDAKQQAKAAPAPKIAAPATGAATTSTASTKIAASPPRRVPQ